MGNSPHEMISPPGVETRTAINSRVLQRESMFPKPEPTVTRFALSLFAAGFAGLAVLLLLALLAIPADEARADSGHPGGGYPLHRAAGESGDLATVVHLLGNAHGVDVDTTTTDNVQTPLHHAAIYARAAIAATLIVAGAGVNAKDDYGDTPLHQAAGGHYTTDGDYASVVSVLIAAGADLEVKDNSGGDTPLHEAASGGRVSVVSLLLAAGAEVNATNSYGNTPLRRGAGNASVVSLLLAAGASERSEYICRVAFAPAQLYNSAKEECVPFSAQSCGGLNPPEFYDAATGRCKAFRRWGRYPLHYAAGSYGDLEAVIQLLRLEGAHKVDVNAAPSVHPYYGATPLHEAAEYGRAIIAATLIAAGAEVNATIMSAVKNTGRTPLHEGARRDHASVVSVLLTAGADVNAKGNYGWTPLHDAASNGHAAIAALLLAVGAEVNATNIVSRTPLHESAFRDHASVVLVLLAAGAEVNVKDNYGNTPLHDQTRNASVVSLLLAAGANVNAENNSGNTPLHIAGQASVVSLLLAAGASVNVKNDDDETPLRNTCYPSSGCPSFYAPVRAVLIAAGGHWGEDCGVGVVNPEHYSPPCLCESPNIGTGDNCQAPSAQGCGGLTPPEFYDAAGGKCVALSAQGCARTSPPSFYSPTLSVCAPHDECVAAGNCVLNADICARRFTPDRFYDSAAGECVPFAECDSTAALALNRVTNECGCTADRSRRYLRTSGICESSCNAAENAVLKGSYYFSGYRRDYYECKCLSAKWETETTTVNGACEFLYPCHDSAVRKADNSGCECPAGTYAHGDPSGGFRHDNYDQRSYSSHYGRCYASGSRNEYGRCVHIPDSAECHSAPDGHHAPLAHDLNGWTVAITLNDPEIVSHFIADHGQDPDANYELHLAAANDYHLAATALLAGGANPDLKNGDGDAPLHLATRAGLARIVSILLAADADPDLKDRRGDGALHLALRDHADGLVSLLLAADANVNLQGDGGDTPLHLETRAGRLGMVSLFLGRGANPDIANAQGETPLHLAARDSAFGIVKHLLDHEANPDAIDSDGDTPLHEMARLADAAGNVALVSLLLDKGADPNIRNGDGWRPLDLAYDNGGRRDARLARRMMMAALIAGGADWASECTGGKIPNEHYRPPEVSDCKCPNHLAVDNNGVCECPAETHAQVNGRCLGKGSAQLDEEIEIVRAELAELRAALVSLNLRLSLAAADAPQEELEEVAALAEQAARGIARRRDVFRGLGRADLAGAAPVVGLSDTAATCRMLGGDVEGDARVCSGIDFNDTFCLIDSDAALSCVGFFRHVRRCNDDHNRPALDPWHCAARCPSGLRARGARCASD